MLRESFCELETEAQIAPLDLKFPPEVTQTLEEFTQKHFLDPAKLIPLAMKAHSERLDHVGEDVNRLMQELGPINAAAPEFPLATSAIAPLRSKAESLASGDFSPLWCGQNASGCKEMPAAQLTRELAANL